MKIQKHLLIGIAILLMIPVIGCTKGPSSEEVIAKAYAAASELQSYRVEGSAIIPPELGVGLSPESTFEMEIVAPNRVHCTMCWSEDRGKDEFITIGDKQYSRHYWDSKWTQWGLNPRPSNGYGITVSEPKQTLLLLDALTNLEELQDERVEGVDCLHYRAKVDMGKIVEEQKAKLAPSMPKYKDILKGLDRQRQLEIEVEIWIGKEDYLIWQIKQAWQTPLGEEKWATQSSLSKYYDFNEPIKIESPQIQAGTGVHLVWDGSQSISGEDPKHQQIHYHMTITNMGYGLARSVRLYAITRATNEEMEQPWMRKYIEAEPSTPPPIDLEPGESKTYNITWEYDITGSSKEELSELLKGTSILIRWSGEEGASFSQSIPHGKKREEGKEIVAIVQSKYKGNKCGLSSGFIVNSDGYIVTFLGSILEAEQIEVILSDGRTFPASVVKTDKATELVLLKIETKGLTAATLGDASELKVGDYVRVASCVPVHYVEIGAEVLDLDYKLPDFGSSTIKLNNGGWPGTAGGPLFNAEGEVVGVMVAVNVETRESFIVPINQVEKLLEQKEEAIR